VALTVLANGLVVADAVKFVNTNLPFFTYYIYPDHLNTPRALTNSNNQLVWRWDTADPFGSLPANSNPSGLGTFTFNLRFPGQYFDSESNLHYNYMRDYDPSIGRYIQSDPIGLKGGINTYAYVGGNPVSKSDPTGLISPQDQFVLCMTAWTVAVTRVCLNPGIAVGTCSVCALLPPPFNGSCAAYCVTNPITFCGAGTTLVGAAICTVQCAITMKQ